MYQTSLQHILAELERLDLLLRTEVWRARQGRGEADELAAFYIPEAEADELLDKAIGTPAWARVPLPAQLAAAVQARLDQLSADIAERAEQSLGEGIPLRLAGLAQAFDLTGLDLDVILICLAPELDRAYERLYAYLHDDVTRRHPSVDLILSLLCPGLAAKVAARARLTAAAPLLRHHLVQLHDEPGQRSGLGQTVLLDPRVAGFLLGDDAVDDRLRPYASLATPAARLDELVLPAPFRHQLDRLTRYARAARDSPDGAQLVLYFQGPYGVGKRTAAAACGQALGQRLLTVAGRQLAGCDAREFAALAGLIDREARLQGALLYWEDFDALLAEENDRPAGGPGPHAGRAPGTGGAGRVGHLGTRRRPAPGHFPAPAVPAARVRRTPAAVASGAVRGRGVRRARRRAGPGRRWPEASASPAGRSATPRPPRASSPAAATRPRRWSPWPTCTPPAACSPTASSPSWPQDHPALRLG